MNKSLLVMLGVLMLLATGSLAAETDKKFEQAKPLFVPPPDPTINDVIDLGKNILRPLDNNILGAIKDAFRNFDNIGEALSLSEDFKAYSTRLKYLGAAGEFVDLLSKTVKVTDEFGKHTPEGDRNGWRLAKVETMKFFAGNAAGGEYSMATAEYLIAIGYSPGAAAVAAIAAGWFATTTVEDAIDAVADQNKKLSDEEMKTRAYNELEAVRGDLHIPVDARETWREDEDGNKLREVTWTDDDGKTFVYGTCYDSLGHNTGSEFGDKETYDHNMQEIVSKYPDTESEVADDEESNQDDEDSREYKGTLVSANGAQPLTIHIRGSAVEVTVTSIQLKGSVNDNGELSASWEKSETIVVCKGHSEEATGTIRMTGTIKGSSAKGNMELHMTGSDGTDMRFPSTWTAKLTNSK